MDASVNETAHKSILAELARLGGQIVGHEDIRREGKTFIIPETMELMDAARFIAAKIAEESESMTFSRTFRYRPMDGARAAHNVFRNIFGGVVQRNRLFQGAQLVTVNVGPNQTEQVPWGAMVLPTLPDCIVSFDQVTDTIAGDLFVLKIEGPRKWRHHVEGLFALVEEELATNSLYRGRAWTIDGTFMDLATVDPSSICYSADVITQLEANVWSMIEQSSTMESFGVKLKRAVLLEGPYGSGKTEAARLTAKKATEATEPWTFLYARPGDDLAMVLATAELYQPAVVFFEDIDKLADPQNMDADAVSNVLDMFDGITNKGVRLLAILTTNHVDRLHKGMLRPGRLDAVVHIADLDRDGFERLGRRVIPAELQGDIDWGVAFEAARGYLPSFLREGFDRTVRYAVVRANGSVVVRITTQDIIDAMAGMRAQHDLLLAAGEHDDQADNLTATVAAIVDRSVAAGVEAMQNATNTAARHVARTVVSEGCETREGMVDALNETEVHDNYGDKTAQLSVDN